MSYCNPEYEVNALYELSQRGFTRELKKDNLISSGMISPGAKRIIERKQLVNEIRATLNDSNKQERAQLVKDIQNTLTTTARERERLRALALLNI